MAKVGGYRGISATGVIDFVECSKAASENPVTDHEPIDGPLELHFEEQPDCSNCRDNCCVAPHVTELCRDDIMRLEAAGLEWAIAPGNAQNEQSPSLKQNDGRCVFLTTENLCSIYVARPLVCRAFPVQVANADAEQLRFSSACRSRMAITRPNDLQRMAKNARLSFETKQSELKMAQQKTEKLLTEGLGRYYGLKSDSQPLTETSFTEILRSKIETTKTESTNE